MVRRFPEDSVRKPSHKPARRLSETDFRVAKAIRQDRLKQSVGNRMSCLPASLFLVGETISRATAANATLDGKSLFRRSPARRRPARIATLWLAASVGAAAFLADAVAAQQEGMGVPPGAASRSSPPSLRTVTVDGTVSLKGSLVDGASIPQPPVVSAEHATSTFIKISRLHCSIGRSQVKCKSRNAADIVYIPVAIIHSPRLPLPDEISIAVIDGKLTKSKFITISGSRMTTENIGGGNISWEPVTGPTAPAVLPTMLVLCLTPQGTCQGPNARPAATADEGVSGMRGSMSAGAPMPAPGSPASDEGSPSPQGPGRRLPAQSPGGPRQPEARTTVALTVRGFPSQYEPAEEGRLVVGALSGIDNADDVRIAREPDQRHEYKLSIKSEIQGRLRIGGQPITCTGGSCRAELKLEEWTLFLEPFSLGGADQAEIRVLPPVPNFPFEQLQLGQVGAGLPVQQRIGERRPHAQFWVADTSRIEVQIGNDIKVEATLQPPGTARRELTFGARPTSEGRRWVLHLPGDAAAVPSRLERPTTPVQPPSRGQTVVIEVSPPAGWSAEQATGRLRTLIQNRKVSLLRTLPGDREGGVEQNTPEVVNRNLLSWTGLGIDDGVNLSFDDPRLTLKPVPASSIPIGGSLRSREIKRAFKVSIPGDVMADAWNVGIRATTREYGTDRPIVVDNSLCRFQLAGSGQTVPLEGAGDQLRSKAPVPAETLAAATQLETRAASGSARCQSQTVQLREKEWTREGDQAVMRSRALLAARGRWLLGLYAPQGLGGGGGDGPVLDARNQILDFVPKTLNAWRGRFFSNASDPAGSALGADLILASGAEIPAGGGFATESLLAGGLRQQRISDLRLDEVAENRVNAFLNGPRGAGSAPSFAILRGVIDRYASLFGPPSEDRLPLVFYVGAAVQPTPASCAEWRQMTESVKARVIALAFSTSETLRQDLGSSRDVREERSPNGRLLGYACGGANASWLLFTPFQQLTSLRTETVLDALGRKLDGWVERGEQ